MTMRKEIFKYVEREISDYHHSVKEYKQLRGDMIHLTEFDENPDENTGVGRSNQFYSPTEHAVTRIMGSVRLKALEQVISAIDEIYESCEPIAKELIELKYWRKSQQLTWDGIAQQLNVSRRTAINYRNKIVELVGERLGMR